jgi:prepilin-type N-terminal cleavage/methylation domain-containing protein
MKAKLTESAYTLIEILVVLSIIGILFAVGYANYRGFSRRQVLQGAIKTVQGDLRKTQQSAMSGIKPDSNNCNSPETLNGYSFNVESLGTQYGIYAVCSGGNVQLGSSIDLPSGITMSISSNPILFKVLGSGTDIASSGTVVTLTQATTNNSLTITVGPGGDIQ